MGMVVEHENDSGLTWYARFARHPYYPPQGLNAGLLFVNAERLRNDRDFRFESMENVGFSDLLIPIQQKYNHNLTWGDQCLLNVLWEANRSKLKPLSCELNYRTDHCVYGENCGNAPVIIHGSRSAFLKPDTEKSVLTVMYNVINTLTDKTVALRKFKSAIKKYADSQNGKTHHYGREM